MCSPVFTEPARSLHTYPQMACLRHKHTLMFLSEQKKPRCASLHFFQPIMIPSFARYKRVSLKLHTASSCVDLAPAVPRKWSTNSQEFTSRVFGPLHSTHTHILMWDYIHSSP
ncbi:hypothetical protein ILYODFUR_007237 [Ilyodon furcidens]|uniref:Uncharacterized protein n=1 Tax=Ilyodon furcidens TaxID=33524 RepID=A0ABV0TVE4_9TELE